MSSRALARCAGLFYALNFVLGIAALIWAQQGRVAAAEQATVSAAVEYAIVVLLLACLFEPAGNRRSWGVAAIGLVGCAASAVGPLDIIVSPVSSSVHFVFLTIIVQPARHTRSERRAGKSHCIGALAIATGGTRRCALPQSVSSRDADRSDSTSAAQTVSSGSAGWSATSFAVRASDSRAILPLPRVNLPVTPRIAVAAIRYPVA